MVVNTILAAMAEIGFSEYEARVYVGALREGRATAYQIAKSAGVPTSKIYEVIARLVDKGVLLPMGGEEKSSYAPCPPEEFIARRKDRLRCTFDDLAGALKSLGGPRETSLVWNLREYREVMERASRMIAHSREHLLVSAWPDELAALSGEIVRAAEREVKTAVVYFGNPGEGQPSGAGIPQSCRHVCVFGHPIADTLYQERGGRGFTLIADSSEAMMATMFTGGGVEGACSANRGFVLLAEDYVKHDIYIMKIVGRYDEELLRRFGAGYAKLRDVYSDQEESHESLDERGDR